MKKIKNLIIIGKEYFDKVNGNSYHTATVFVNGLFFAKSNIEYGYGDQYIGTATDMLIKAGYLKDMGSISTVLWRYAEEKKISLYTTKIEGLTKKQL